MSKQQQNPPFPQIKAFILLTCFFKQDQFLSSLFLYLLYSATSQGDHNAANTVLSPRHCAKQNICLNPYYAHLEKPEFQREELVYSLTVSEGV